ncbi:MAG: hypothetical protein ACP5RS_06005 [Thermoplasmata archaeon]
MLKILYIAFVVSLFMAPHVFNNASYQYKVGVDNVNTPVLTTSSSGIISLHIYNFFTHGIENVTFIAGIYEYVKLTDNISENTTSMKIPLFNGHKTFFENISFIPAMTNYTITFNVSANGVNVGDYLVRLMIRAFSNGTYLTFKSKGFFNALLWNNATKNGLNYTLLNVNGILPEFAIEVTTDYNYYAIYALLSVSGVFFFLAVYFYVKSFKKGK